MRLMIAAFFLTASAVMALAQETSKKCEVLSERIGLAIDAHTYDAGCVGFQAGIVQPLFREHRGAQYDLQLGAGDENKPREWGFSFATIGRELASGVVTYRGRLAKKKGVALGAAVQGGYDFLNHGVLYGGYGILDYTTKKNTQIVGNMGCIGDTAGIAEQRLQCYGTANIIQQIRKLYYMFATGGRYVGIGFKPYDAVGGGVAVQVGRVIFDATYLRANEKSYALAGVAIRLH